MEQLTMSFPASQKLTKLPKVQVGVVSSGDMEVLLEADAAETLRVSICSSADNSAQRWRDIFERISETACLPSGKMTIHDFGATPGVVRLRVEQALEEALNA